jgi:hypothetical protein
MKSIKKYTSITIKKELKGLMDLKIKDLGIDMTYSAYIKYLISKNEENLLKKDN